MKEKTEFTTCISCVHLLNLSDYPLVTDIWYNHFCKANKAPVHRDPFDGKVKPMGGNKYMYCSDINTCGSCNQYKKKTGLLKKLLHNLRRAYEKTCCICWNI